MSRERPVFQFLSADLAPGDGQSAALATNAFEIVRIDNADHPRFAEAYAMLWNEFGSRRELEDRAVLARRLQWDPVKPLNGCALLYDLLAIRHGDQIIAVRDHTAIVPLDHPTMSAVVHLSHVLVDQSMRRTGLAGWLRALPIQTSRECLRRAGGPATAPITLVAEMEYPRLDAADSLVRLRAYEKAGFRKIDPARVPYLQPDFRPPAQIDDTGGPHPLPFALLVRRLGREHEQELTGAEAVHLARTLYRMYGVTFRAQDMAAVLKNLEKFPRHDELVRLLPPSEPNTEALP